MSLRITPTGATETISPAEAVRRLRVIEEQLTYIDDHLDKGSIIAAITEVSNAIQRQRMYTEPEKPRVSSVDYLLDSADLHLSVNTPMPFTFLETVYANAIRHALCTGDSKLTDIAVHQGRYDASMVLMQLFREMKRAAYKRAVSLELTMRVVKRPDGSLDWLSDTDS